MRTIPEGYEARLGVVVSDEMTVEFGELGALHPVYATYWMAKHMEEAGRKIILPFLEPHEDGVGSALTLRHHAPVHPGARLEVVARHERTDGNRIHVRCEVRDESGALVGQGSTEQVVLPRDALDHRFAT